MKAFVAFTKKELTSHARTMKIMIFGILFLLIAVLNVATAKFTPALMEMMSDMMAESGMTVTVGEPTALDSWTQFFKNIPVGIIVFVVLESGIFTGEYRSGTLVLSLTKGLDRKTVVASKTVVMTLLWTASYWLCFGATYAGNMLFWDNSLAKELGFAAFCTWLFGIFLISVTVLASTVFSSNIGVLLTAGGTVMVFYLAGMIPKIGRFFPTYLADGTSLVYGLSAPDDYLAAAVITAAASVVCLAASFPLFDKKQL